jgi:outer membrane protein
MRSSFLLVLTAALTVSAVAHADIKLGYVDLQRALQEVAEGKDARARLKTELDKKKSEFEAEQAKLRDDKAVLDKQGSMMSEEVRNQKFTELQKRLFELTQRAEKLQAEMASAEQKELKKIFEKMDPIIAAIAKREELTMVFEKTDSGLVYAPASLDLTNELVRTYNDKYKVAVAPAPAQKGGGAAPAPKDTAAAPKK